MLEHTTLEKVTSFTQAGNVFVGKSEASLWAFAAFFNDFSAAKKSLHKKSTKTVRKFFVFK